MRNTALFVCAVLLSLPRPAEALSPYGSRKYRENRYLFEAPTIKTAVLPAYQVAEGVSDRLYGFVSSRLFTLLMPETMHNELFAPPEQDSYDLFVRHFQKKEDRFLRRIHDSHPRFRPDGGNGDDPLRVLAWQDQARREQVSVFIDVFRDTLMDRYQLHLFQSSSERYARDRDNWNPAFILMGTAVGGGFLFYNGMHATMNIEGIKLGLDITSGRRIMSSAKDRTELRHAGGLELGYANIPLKLSTDYTLRQGRLYHDTIAVNFSQRF